MYRKFTYVFMACCFLSVSAWAQDIMKNKKDGHYEFEIQESVDYTPVKNQNKSSTCWSFAGVSFFESELMRMGKDQYNLSDMYVVRKTYEDKARRYVRMHGKLRFSAGGAFHDVSRVLDNYGMVPEKVYPGEQMGYKKPVHMEMDAILENMVETVIKNKNGKLSPAWDEAYSNVLDAYLGEEPQEFTYEGTTYTPESFAGKKLELDADNYVELSSFTHHPFYEKFILKVPDNWQQRRVHNLPMDELMQVMDNALANNYSVAWATDVSEKGFAHRHGLAIVPAKDWDKMTKAERDSALTYPVEQRDITQKMRQKAYDNYQTQDDHGMHITGIANDQDGRKYYITKNSWGKSNDCGGFLYASEAYVKYKTIDIMVHKDAIPDKIAKKLDL